ncbi:MAG TPA: NUDIX domain-containing protein [Candidatus Saccharimonadales bacterium]|nr:NUDIX domain-containing protein [Candidatus Saccharimonadales bacterium]
MKLLKTIQFNNLTPEEIEDFEVREAARAVVFDEDKNVALLYVAKYNRHKLPGGGVEEHEGVEEALYRECLEEIGCQVEKFAEVGEIVEYRDKWSLEQHSYCFLAKVIGAKGEPNFTPEEKVNGFEIKWVSFEEAIELLKQDDPEDYEGKFIKIRDAIFLKEAYEIIT